jgi:Baseplate J-like protein
MIYSCCNENRRAAILGNPSLNGIDYLELLDQNSGLPGLYQQTLLVHCLKAAPTTLGPGNILITGGESITGITAEWVLPANINPALVPPNTATPAEVAYFNLQPNAANILVVRTSAAGDFSPYTLRLVNNAQQAEADTFDVTEALSGFDPQLAEVTFSFKVECPPFFDCKPPAPDCAPPPPTAPPINYLAKDYGSFRTVVLDRLNQLLPSWGASSEADLGVALAELMAYTGDQLSYQQDAVATEAYLLTARSRISLRRHALLVDYRVHDGCNARAWIQLNVASPFTLDRTKTRFYTFAPGMPSTLAIGMNTEQAALDAGVVVFEPMQDADLFPEHNLMQFYTWGDTNCCLPKGATEATLTGSFPNLHVGDVLIFEEVMGPQTGFAADADIRHRYAVRLTSVATQNGLGQPLVDPLFEAGTGKPITSAGQLPTPVTEIQWSTDDALPAPLCLSSSFIDSSGKQQNLTGVSVVLGNVVLADQGLTMPATPLPTVPEPTLYFPPSSTADRCNPSQPQPFPVRYRPLLPQSPVTQAVPLALAGSPVTPNAVPLLPSGFVSISDANGFATLMVEADAPLNWPQYFGIVATANPGLPATFNLSVVFNPSGGAPGVTSPVYLETFSNLTLTASVSNNVATAINGVSQFITVTPVGTTTPTAFPTAPTMLPNTGTVTLDDAATNPYLTVQPTNPLSWPPLFAVLAQGNLVTPSMFNLLLLYQPNSGGIGVSVPTVVEQFNNLSLGTIAATFSAPSTLLTVLSFDQEPNPAVSAYELMHFDASEAVPVITLTGTFEGVNTTWTPAPDLLADGPTDTNFVVEVETNGAAYLRFGDGTNGQRPLPNTAFTAIFRIGNGTAGNVGADSITHFAADPRIQSCTNPIPATGGIDLETPDQIRRRAPLAFETQERAITMPDYAHVTEANPQVEDAAATLRWTGSWYTVFITAEPQGGGLLTKPLQHTLTKYVNRYRLAGQDIQLEGPAYISLEITLSVCVDPDYFQAYVQQSLMQVLGGGTLPDGRPALFAPGAFKLGQTVYLSPIYAAARTVPGVQSVAATVFQPQGFSTNIYLQNGEIPLGPFQVARMDNDPSRPANGQLTLKMQGGK